MDDYSIRFDPRAESDVEGATEWYEDIETGLGLEFLQVLDATIEAIRGNPLRWLLSL